MYQWCVAVCAFLCAHLNLELLHLDFDNATHNLLKWCSLLHSLQAEELQQDVYCSLHGSICTDLHMKHCISRDRQSGVCGVCARRRKGEPSCPSMRQGKHRLRCKMLTLSFGRVVHV